MIDHGEGAEALGMQFSELGRASVWWQAGSRGSLLGASWFTGKPMTSDCDACGS
jgi:hypothetical protein